MVRQESVWRILGLFPLIEANEMEERQKNQNPTTIFFSLRTGISHLQPVSENDPEAFIITRNLLTS